MFSVAPSTSPSGCFSPVASMPTAATRTRSSWTCRPSMWIASRSRDDRSLASQSFSFALDSATNLRDAAVLEVPSPLAEVTSPSGRRTERRNRRVKTLISIWFIAHRPSQSSRWQGWEAPVPAGRQASEPVRCRPGRHEKPPGSFPSGAGPHGAGGARRTDQRPLPPEDPGTLRSRPADRSSQSCSEPPGRLPSQRHAPRSPNQALSPRSFHGYSSSRALLLYVDSAPRAYWLRGAAPTSDLQHPSGHSRIFPAHAQEARIFFLAEGVIHLHVAVQQ